MKATQHGKLNVQKLATFQDSIKAMMLDWALQLQKIDFANCPKPIYIVTMPWLMAIVSWLASQINIDTKHIIEVVPCYWPQVMNQATLLGKIGNWFADKSIAQNDKLWLAWINEKLGTQANFMDANQTWKIIALEPAIHPNLVLNDTTFVVGTFGLQPMAKV